MKDCYVICLQVLHIDRNNYYGGQSASLNLNQVRGRPAREWRNKPAHIGAQLLR